MGLFCHNIFEVIVLIGKARIRLKLTHAVTFHNSSDSYTMERQPPSANAEEIAGFSDVDENAVYAEAIRWAEEQGYVNGFPPSARGS